VELGFTLITLGLTAQLIVLRALRDTPAQAPALEFQRFVQRASSLRLELLLAQTAKKGIIAKKKA